MSSNKGRVAGKVALVTGAASGLGAETARRLAREGAQVVLSDRNHELGAEIALEITGDGGDALFVPHDVALEADWQAVIAATLARYGKLDVLINNAGIASNGGELMTHTLADWRTMMSINLDGVFLGMRYGGEAIAAGGRGGSIVNLSSILGKVGFPGAAAYCASKGGVLLLTKAAALEWAPLNIRVNTVHPGFIETPMVATAIRESENANEMRDQLIAAHALGRLGMPREIADAMIFLASDESSFMTGAELVIDGGYTAR
jgi:NAD(P)-dependent dehydrogenase (short-subunit alcohol dehydrogenase family)